MPETPLPKKAPAGGSHAAAGQREDGVTLFPPEVAPPRWPCVPRNGVTGWWQPLPGRQEPTELFLRQMETLQSVWGLCCCGRSLLPFLGCAAAAAGAEGKGPAWPQELALFSWLAAEFAKFTLKQFLVAKCSFYK